MVQCVWRLSCACDNLLITILSFFFPLPHPHFPTPFPFNSWFSHLWGNHKELVRSLTFHLLFSGVCCDGQLFFCPFVSTKSFIYSAPPQRQPFPTSQVTIITLPLTHAPRSLRHCGVGATGGLKCSAHLSPGPHPQRAPQGCQCQAALLTQHMLLCQEQWGESIIHPSYCPEPLKLIVLCICLSYSTPSLFLGK